jgi:hypothetical protein
MPQLLMQKAMQLMHIPVQQGQKRLAKIRKV